MNTLIFLAGKLKPLALAVLLQVLAADAIATQLTIERLFAAPDLSGESLRSASFSPDGKLVAYLKPATDDKNRLDLWAYDLRLRQHRQLVDSRRLLPSAEVLSADEESRRERQRTSALSGIVEYRFSPDSQQLLVPLGGDLYLYDLKAAAGSAVRRLTTTDSYETDARFSPRGRYVSFIRDQNLVVLELATGRETALTRDGAGTVSFGMAEFIAQEEMDRTTGYWWSPDDARIAYTRVDEATVPETQRFEINAADVTVVRQRYPYAGGANAVVSLQVARIDAPQAVTSMDLGVDEDFYLARVDFFPDGRSLAVQRQSRDQRRLDLLRIDVATGTSRVLLTETSDTWVPLHDELTLLHKAPQFIWASQRSGYKQLYLYDTEGRLLRQLTRGDVMTVGDRLVAAVRGLDEKRRELYYMSAAGGGTERQLHRLSLDRPEQVTQLTAAKGWHSTTVAEDGSAFVDVFSNSETPPSVSLYDRAGRKLQDLVANRLDATHPYFPYVDSHAISEFGTLTASDGQQLNYQLLKPRALLPGHRYPVIVSVYGGPGVQNVTNVWGGSGQLFNQLLVAQGFVVFSVDNRGSGFRGTRFETALFHRMGSVEVDDQVTGAQFLKTLPFVDPARIGISGWSYGGYMALLAVTKHPETFAAAIAGAPVTDWRLYDTHYTERYMGTPAANPEGYTAADVLTYAPRLSRPLLLIHGMADDNVLFTHSTQLMRTLQAANRPFELMTYPGGKHGLTRHKDMGPHAYAAMLDFFKRHLMDAVD